MFHSHYFCYLFKHCFKGFQCLTSCHLVEVCACCCWGYRNALLPPAGRTHFNTLRPCVYSVTVWNVYWCMLLQAVFHTTYIWIYSNDFLLKYFAHKYTFSAWMCYFLMQDKDLMCVRLSFNRSYSSWEPVRPDHSCKYSVCVYFRYPKGSSFMSIRLRFR